MQPGSASGWAWRKLTFCLRLWHRVHAVLFLFLGFKPVPTELEDDDMNEEPQDEKKPMSVNRY